MIRRSRVTVIGFVMAASTLSACAASQDDASIPGNDETDRIARVVADAISYPRQESADALTRAAVDTSAGRDGRLSVLIAEDLQADELVDPLARLVFRVHLEAYQAGLTSVESVTACYEGFFSYYGVIDPPGRVECPPVSRAITPEPIEPTPRLVIPDGADEAVRRTLSGFPSAVTTAEVVDALTAALPGLEPDPESGITDIPVTPEVVVAGSDIGVAMRADAGSCLFGARTGGEVDVWYPSRDEVQPGELTCDPETALGIVRQVG